MISQHLDKNNLHHAYLLEGEREIILPEILLFMENLGVSILNNPDFCQINIDNFKMDEAIFLRSMTDEKSFSSGKKIFLISANKFSLDAEHALLKMFEEPKKDTHFFLIIPDKNALLDTLVSRFYLIPMKVPTKGTPTEVREVENFIKMSVSERITFLKDFLKDETEDDEVLVIDSVRAKSLRFLNNLETILHKNVHKNLSCFEQLFQVRKFLRQPGSSTKNLMESLALIIPKDNLNF